MPEMNASRPTILEWALAACCILAGSFTIILPRINELFWGRGHDPYARYYQDVGIDLINLAALTVDVLIVVLVVGWLFSRRAARHVLTAVMVLAAIGAALTWIELCMDRPSIMAR